MKISSVQMPMPVFRSGVRLAAKLTPHGPENAVFVTAPAHPHLSASARGVSITTCCGWPESARLMSGSGPFGPIFQGVWQSLQPPIVTRYSPRLICACLSKTGLLATTVFEPYEEVTTAVSETATPIARKIVKSCLPPSFIVASVVAGNVGRRAYLVLTGVITGAVSSEARAVQLYSCTAVELFPAQSSKSEGSRCLPCCPSPT